MKFGILAHLTWVLCISVGGWLTTPSLAVIFVPPENNVPPPQRSGGADRSSFQFIPPPDNSSPDHTSSGASRVGFIPPPDNASPRQTASGASRGTIGFIPPPEQPAPQQPTASGASRSGEGESFIVGSNVPGDIINHMMAVTPLNFYGGLTVSARPTVMAYLPPTSAQAAVFSLKDETEAVIYQQVVSLNRTGGILTIHVSEDAPELVIGEYYHWFVTLQIEDYITPGSPYVDGWVKRIEPTTAIAEAMASPDTLTKAEILAQSGIWYDAATHLASLQTPSSTNSKQVASWTEFLTSVGLDDLIHSSFL